MDVVIVTRTKNRPRMLKRALDSVSAQRYSHYHHVIVNDGGDPIVVNQLVKLYDDPRVHVIHHPTSLGMEAASNAGLKAKPATFAVIHDDDDCWDPDFLSLSVEYLQKHPHHAGVVCNINQIFENVDDICIRSDSSRLFNPAVECFRLDDFFVANQFVPIAFLYRYSLHDQVGFYNESLKVCGDLEFYIRVLRLASIGKINKCLAHYHIRKSYTPNKVAAANSVAKKAEHKAISKQIRSQYDSRSQKQKLSALWRVKFYYRLKNQYLRRFKTAQHFQRGIK